MLQAVFVFPKLVTKLKKTTPARSPRPPRLTKGS
jgi:hypothetical protein